MLGRLAMSVVAALALASAGCAGTQSMVRPGEASAQADHSDSANSRGDSRDRDVNPRALSMAGEIELPDSQDPIPIVPAPSTPSDASFSRWPGDGMGGHHGGGNPVARWNR